MSRARGAFNKIWRGDITKWTKYFLLYGWFLYLSVEDNLKKENVRFHLKTLFERQVNN